METQRKKAQKLHKGKATAEIPPDPEPVTSSMDINYDDFIDPLTTTPVEVRAPIPEEQQREILKWMLEEKRKMMPKDAVEKKQIDEDKAILKQFLRAESIPKI